jgi:predicted chitinase
MIISPPFLPEVGALEEAAWLDAAMAPPLSKLQDTLAPEGSFPLSRALAWHNGVHLQAPKSAAGAFLPVRAIADGRVVFVHEPTKPVHSDKPDADHPLNYNPFGSPPAPAWTSDGFLVIEHTTEIGAAGTTPTEIRYFSAYMHLASLAPCPGRKAAWQAGDAVHRKDELGAPGAIYGHAGQIHFEICCDEAQLRRILGREPEASDPLEPAAPTADGRTDSVFGSIHVYLPAGTPTRGAAPVEHLRPSRTATDSSALPGQVVPDTLAQAQWVSITCDKGSATVASFDRFGQPIGTAPPETDFEYNLYAEASRRHDSLSKAQSVTPAAPASSGAPAAAAGSMPPPPSSSIRSSPSGWYELLRFARKLGPDPLPEAAAHWRRIATPQGLVWVDLNAPGTFKFSDADFLPALGWHCFGDDATPTDQRCDSLRLKRLISDRDPANPHRLTTGHLVKRLGRGDVRALLRRAICRFPSEWDQKDIEARYGWLTTVDGQASDDDANAIRKWQRFVAHARALSFPDLPADFLQAQWRFHPREFIGVMRKCGWLSTAELNRVYSNTPVTTIQQYVVAFNQMTRKYGFNVIRRLPHMLGQGAVESDAMKSMQETAQALITQDGRTVGGKIYPDSRKNERELGHWWGALQEERVEWYGATKFNSKGLNIATSYNWRSGNMDDPDAQKFRGRGFKQLTGLFNYSEYWVYRGWLQRSSFDASWWRDPQYEAKNRGRMAKRSPVIENPQVVAANPFNCMDSGGWYMCFQRNKVLIEMDTDNLNKPSAQRDLDKEKDIIKKVTYAINGGQIGDEERLFHTRKAKKIIYDY